MTARRLDCVGAGHPRPCGRAPGRSKALGGGAALASSSRVWAVLLNTLLRDFTETRHGKDPGSVRLQLLRKCLLCYALLLLLRVKQCPSKAEDAL